MKYLTILSLVGLASACAIAGTFKDNRDGKTYKTVDIGGVTWFAENLNFKTGGSYCYDDDPGACGKYGRLYTFDAAQKACPDGWHLPTSEDWKILEEDTQGKSLKASFDWEGKRSKNDVGFSGLPAGFRNSKGKFEIIGKRADFWSADEADDQTGKYWFLSFRNEKLDNNKYSKKGAMSVRCVEDNTSYARGAEMENVGGCEGTRDAGMTIDVASTAKYTTCTEMHDYGCGWNYDFSIYTYPVGNGDCVELYYPDSVSFIAAEEVINFSKVTDTKLRKLLKKKNVSIFLTKSEICVYEDGEDFNHMAGDPREICTPFKDAKKFLTPYGNEEASSTCVEAFRQPC